MVISRNIGLLVLSFCLCLCYYANGFPDDSYTDGHLSLLVEDSLEDGPSPSFVPRSTITIRSVMSGNAIITHTRKWEDRTLNILKQLAIDGGLYRIRVHQIGSEGKGYVSTFTKACLLYESGLTEILSVMVDDTGKSITGISLFTPISVCSGPENMQFQENFNTTIIVRSPIQAPLPDTATYIQKIEAMKSEKAEGKDNRSFLAKYWMYIVPVVLILLISGGGQEK